MEIIDISLAILAILVTFTCFIAYSWFKLNSKNIEFNTKTKVHENEIERLNKNLTSIQKSVEEHDKELKECNAQKIESQEKLKATIASYEFIKVTTKQMDDNFQKVASQILEQDQTKLKNANKALLEPLNTQIKDFKSRIEELSKGQSDDRSALKQQIQNLSQANQNTIKSAEKLTNALTYDNKQQGDWGETKLRKILENSGLTEGVEYEIQKSYKNESGDRLQPDVIVHLPEKKELIIDSKVSLVAYQNYITNTDDKQALKEHIQSVNRHITNINLKSYENLIGVNTLGFVFVFFPIEASLSIALAKQPNLNNEALRKNVCLVSPSTLIMSLKTVHYIWKTDAQNKNTAKIARQAGDMYDAFANFLKSLNDIKKNLDKATDSYEKAHKQLSSGRGNLLKRTQKLKELGVQSKKELDLSK